MSPKYAFTHSLASRAKPWLTQGRWFLRELVRQFVRHQCLTGAAALTFTTLLALVPLMTVTYLMLSAFPELAAVGAAVEDFLFETFVPNAGAALLEQFAEFSARATELSVASLAVLAISAILALMRIESVFNAIWGASSPRTGMQRLLVYWGALTVGPPLVIGALLATSYLYALPLVEEMDPSGLREGLLAWAPDLAVAAAFTFLYWAVPNTRVPFPHALAGAVLTTLLFGVAKWGFAVFVTQSTTELVYGAFAAAPFFLIWVYLVWVLALGGAVFARTLSLSPAVDDAPPEPLLMQCARVLAVLREAHARGESVDASALDAAARLRPADRERVYAALAAERLTKRTEAGRIAIGRSLDAVTLLALHRRLPEALTAAACAADDPTGSVARRLRAVAASGERELGASIEEALAEGDRQRDASAEGVPQPGRSRNA